jgi:hypothetical protein
VREGKGRGKGWQKGKEVFIMSVRNFNTNKQKDFLSALICAIFYFSAFSLSLAGKASIYITCYFVATWAAQQCYLNSSFYFSSPIQQCAFTTYTGASLHVVTFLRSVHRYFLHAVMFRRSVHRYFLHVVTFLRSVCTGTPYM